MYRPTNIVENISALPEIVKIVIFQRFEFEIFHDLLQTRKTDTQTV